MERSTRQRSAIRGAIETSRHPLSPQEVLEAARLEVPTLSIATVYRNLKQLLEDGDIQAVMLPGDSPRYESSHLPHHHHFQCTVCRQVFNLDRCPGNLSQLAPPGFTVESHELTLYGHCRDCEEMTRR